MNTDNPYLKDIRIDEQALDTEWIDQPALVLTYGSNAAKHEFLMDKAKERINIVKAEMDSAIRKNPEKYGIEKITESAITAVIATDTEMQKVNMEFLDAKYEYSMSIAAVRALQDKKSALENLVRLHGQSYFAGPSVPRDLSSEYAKKHSQSETNEKIAMKRRK